MAGIMSKISSGTGIITHRHFRYKLYFNDIDLTELMESCNLNSQKATIKSQIDAGVENLPHGTEQLLYYDKSHCISCIVTNHLKRSSDARASRNFRVVEEPNDLLLAGSTDREYISEKSVIEIFDSHVLSFNTIETMLLDIERKVDANAQHGSITLGGIKSILLHQLSESNHKKRLLKYELPYGEWLKNAVEQKLAPFGFSVEHQKIGDTIAYANEYILCKSDLVVYHPRKCMDAINVLHILFQSDDSFQVLASPNQSNVSGLICEVKVGSIDEKTNNECYFNMFGEFVKILLKILASGRIVKKVKIFGIAVAAHNHQLAQLLILEVDMDRNICMFKRGASKATFSALFNKVISILNV